MARYLSALFIFLFGCSKAQELPAPIWIDAEFDEARRAIIFSAMERWETATQMDIFDYQGLIAGEFSYDESVGDGRNVIYDFNEPTSDSVRLEEESGVIPFGMSIKQEDIVLYVYHLSTDGLSDAEIFEYYNLSRQEMDSVFQLWLEQAVIHELGHFFGLGHNYLPDCESIMSLSARAEQTAECLLAIGEHDIDEFCSLYDCL